MSALDTAWQGLGWMGPALVIGLAMLAAGVVLRARARHHVESGWRWVAIALLAGAGCLILPGLMTVGTLGLTLAGVYAICQSAQSTC